MKYLFVLSFLLLTACAGEPKDTNGDGCTIESSYPAPKWLVLQIGNVEAYRAKFIEVCGKCQYATIAPTTYSWCDPN